MAVRNRGKILVEALVSSMMSLICQRYGMARWNHCRIVPGRAPSLS